MTASSELAQHQRMSKEITSVCARAWTEGFFIGAGLASLISLGTVWWLA